MLMKELVKFFVRVNLVSPSDGQVSTVYKIPRDLKSCWHEWQRHDRQKITVDKLIEMTIINPRSMIKPNETFLGQIVHGFKSSEHASNFHGVHGM